MRGGFGAGGISFPNPVLTPIFESEKIKTQTLLKRVSLVKVGTNSGEYPRIRAPLPSLTRSGPTVSPLLPVMTFAPFLIY